MEASDKTEPLLSTEERTDPAENAKQPHAGTANDVHEDNGVTVETTEEGSTLRGAIFNFTNTIVGAGAIGLGGAMAQSGGGVSILAILFCAYLTKLSLDLVIRLSVETPGAAGSYEGLAAVSLGKTGWRLVTFSKFLYSFGCLVAYLVVMKDNLGASLLSLGHRLFQVSETTGGWAHILTNPARTTWISSLLGLLPLCLLRDMTPLTAFSLVSIALMGSLTTIVVYLFLANPHDQIRQPSAGFYTDWLEVRPGFLQSLGTFVFAFVSQHTVHLTFSSMRPAERTIDNFCIVTTWSISLAALLSLTVGTTVYLSFWQKADTDMFNCYPDILPTDLAKLLLSVTMILTFPLPFFTCRELLIISFFGSDDGTMNLVEHAEDTEALLTESGGDAAPPVAVFNRSTALLPGPGHQLRLPYHVGLTVAMWVVVVALAISAPSLGDVLDLVGCATGTLIAFVLPGLFSLQLEGYTAKAALLLGVGGVVGTIGTFFSLKTLFMDALSNDSDTSGMWTRKHT